MYRRRHRLVKQTRSIVLVVNAILQPACTICINYNGATSETSMIANGTQTAHGFSVNELINGAHRRSNNLNRDDFSSYRKLCVSGTRHCDVTMNIYILSNDRFPPIYFDDTFDVRARVRQASQRSRRLNFRANCNVRSSVRSFNDN